MCKRNKLHHSSRNGLEVPQKREPNMVAAISVISGVEAYILLHRIFAVDITFEFLERHLDGLVYHVQPLPKGCAVKSKICIFG